MEEWTLRAHAVDRIDERMTLSPYEVLERLTHGVYADVGTAQYPSEQVFTRFVVMWDEGLENAVLFVTRRKRSGWAVVTVYPTRSDHYRSHGIVVLSHHIAYAKKAYQRLRFERERKEMEKDAEKDGVSLYAFLRYKASERFEAKRHRLGLWPWEEFEERFGSLTRLLESAELEKIVTAIPVPEESAIEMRLYRRIYQQPGILLESMVIQEGRHNIDQSDAHTDPP